MSTISQPGVVSVSVVPCLRCGRSDTIRADLRRPLFELPQESPRRQAAVESYLATTPAAACFCLDHVTELEPVLKRLVEPRLVDYAMHGLWFQHFGHPLHAGRMLWRPAKRTRFAPPTAPPSNIKQRLSKLMRRFSRRRTVRSTGRAS